MGDRPSESCLCRPQLCYERYDGCGGWHASNACDYFCRQHEFAVTVVYVHGNRQRDCDAREQGVAVYRQLRRCCPTSCPIRFVIWSWPSEPIPASYRIVRDVRVKYGRTATQSYLLARWLERACPDTRLSLIGYSYGARVIVGALHLLGGGCLEGRGLPGGCCHTHCLNVVLWAAATENAWLSAGFPHQCALRVVDQMLITVNRHDPVLRRFRRCILRARHRALGLTGTRGALCCCGGCGSIDELDVTCLVGRRHHWRKYVCSPTILWHTALVAIGRP